MIGNHPFLDLFFQAYVDAALFASTDDNGKPLDRAPYGVQKLSSEALEVMEADCLRFYTENNLSELSNHDLMRAGHDFWLTRNGHGAGFWDGDWPEPIAAHLTVASHGFGSSDLYVGDDGALYITPTKTKEVVSSEA